MQRIPNTYGPPTTSVPTESVMLGDSEFSQFITGQRGVSTAMRRKIKKVLTHADAKTNLFFAAFAQKGMSRLARVMMFLDKVDDELTKQDWRLKLMSNEDLLDLLDTLSLDRHRSVKELLTISQKFSGLSPSTFDSDDESEDGKKDAAVLSRKERQAVVEFFKRRVVAPKE